MPPKCSRCPHRRNCINGLYCTLTGRYVQYDTIPPCTAQGG